jgi:hypothetical protein
LTPAPACELGIGVEFEVRRSHWFRF